MYLRMEECPVSFWVNVTLTSDLVSRIDIRSGGYLLYPLSWESQIWCMDASLDGDMLC